MAGTLRWNQSAFEDFVRAKLSANMARAMRFAERYAKDLVKIGNQRGKNPSAPGEPPHLGTGTLRRSIASEAFAGFDEVVGRLGVQRGNAEKYARRLELGYVGRDKAGRIVDQAPRPFLRRTLHDKAAEIARIIVKGAA